MEIMTDSNIIVSAILFPNSTVSKVFDYILDNNTLVLCDYIIKEVENVFLEKFPHRISEMKTFMGRIKYKKFELEEKNNSEYPRIRDVNDFPVLVMAIESNVDLLITGDKDFDEVTVDRPRIMKPRKFIDEYIK
jgi:putative PIN family toxin of toxin-antitoxin system